MWLGNPGGGSRALLGRLGDAQALLTLEENALPFVQAEEHHVQSTEAGIA